MLFLFTETLEDVIGADFHDVDFLLETSFWICFVFAQMVLANFSVATTWNRNWLEHHKSAVSAMLCSLTTTLGTESLCLTVWVPVIVGLIQTMVFLKRIIQVTVRPIGLGNHS